MTRDVDIIGQELRLLAAVPATAAEFGPTPSTNRIDALLDERNQHR